MRKNKIGIVVPYRNRREHLNHFIPSVTTTLKEQNIDYEVIIVEQADDKPFNRGKLLNVGVKRAKKLKCNYVALHDVDMLPQKVDYSIVDRPTHLATKFTSDHKEKRIIFDGYFGGVTLFPIMDYYKVNGYSNEYWGWGYEDDDLLFRCKENLFDFNTKQTPIKTSNSAGLEFNGWDSEVKIPMKFGLDNYTILLSFEPYKIDCREELDIDEYSIFCIPGFDTGFSFNSFKRYKFETFTSSKKCISLKSTIQEERRTTLMVVVDQYNKFIKLYQDSELIDEATFEGRLMPYHNQKFMYLGKALEKSQNKRRPFKGIINQLAVWNHSLEPGQVKSVFDNLQLGVTEQFEGYTTPHCLELAYDMKASNYHTLYDLSGNGQNAKIHHCNRVATHHTEDFKEIPIPWRRESTFKLLPHKDNGFYENKWTYTETRKNQLRFYNKVLKGKTNWRRDGMENLKYKIVSDNKLNYADSNNKPVEINFLSVIL